MCNQAFWRWHWRGSWPINDETVVLYKLTLGQSRINHSRVPGQYDSSGVKESLIGPVHYQAVALAANIRRAESGECELT